MEGRPNVTAQPPEASVGLSGEIRHQIVGAFGLISPGTEAARYLKAQWMVVLANPDEKDAAQTKLRLLQEQLDPKLVSSLNKKLTTLQQGKTSEEVTVAMTALKEHMEDKAKRLLEAQKAQARKRAADRRKI